MKRETFTFQNIFLTGIFFIYSKKVLTCCSFDMIKHLLFQQLNIYSFGDFVDECTFSWHNPYNVPQEIKSGLMVPFFTKKLVSINFYLSSHNLYQYHFVGLTLLSLLDLLKFEGKTFKLVDHLISRSSVMTMVTETKNLSLWINYKI